MKTFALKFKLHAMEIRLFVITLCCLVSMGHPQKFKVSIYLLGHDEKPIAESHASLTQNTVNSQVQIPAGSVHDSRYEFSMNTPGCIRSGWPEDTTGRTQTRIL